MTGNLIASKPRGRKGRGEHNPQKPSTDTLSFQLGCNPTGFYQQLPQAEQSMWVPPRQTVTGQCSHFWLCFSSLSFRTMPTGNRKHSSHACMSGIWECRRFLFSLNKRIQNFFVTWFTVQKPLEYLVFPWRTKKQW